MTELKVNYAIIEYEIIEGVATKQQINSYTPFSLKVSKAGYQDLEIPNIAVTAGVPTIIRGEMVAEEPPIYVDINVSGAVVSKEVSGVVQAESVISGVVNVE